MLAIHITLLDQSTQMTNYQHLIVCINITFAIEIEIDNAILFLDILTIRKPGRLKLQYLKKIRTDLYMNWYSFAPKS